MSDERDIPEPGDGFEPRPFSPAEAEMITGPKPPRPHLVALAEEWVRRAQLKFKDFRVDREGIEIAISKAARGDGGISPHDAWQIFQDTGDCVSLPLARRYLEMREFELLAKYLRTRLYFHGFTHMTPRNRLIFDGMIAGGEAAMAVSLLRLYMKKLRDFAQLRWRAAGRKMPSDLPVELRTQFEEQRSVERRALPGQLQIVELELVEIEPYIGAHGSREDWRALEKFREEIAKVRSRFDLPPPR